jgi:hypothetical protein
MKLNATVTSRPLAGTAWLTAKRYNVFPIRLKYRPIKNQLAYISAVPAGSREVTVAFNFISERTVHSLEVSIHESASPRIRAVTASNILTVVAIVSKVVFPAFMQKTF